MSELSAGLKSPTRSALAIALAFAALAGAWVLLIHVSLNALMIAPQNYVRYDAPADGVLALITTLVIFLLLRHELIARERVMEALRRSHEDLELRVQQRTRALDAERDKLLRILDSMPDGICIISQDCDLEYLNPVMERQWGPVQDRKCHVYFNDRAEPCPWCTRSPVFAGQTARSEWFSKKTQQLYELVSIPSTRPDGQVTMLRIFRDITARRAAEAVQAQLLDQIDSERRFLQAVTDYAPASIALFDGAELRVKWVNGQYHRNLAAPYRDADVIGLSLTTLFPDAAGNGMLDVFRGVATTGQSHFDPELAYWEPGRGQTYWQWFLLAMPISAQEVPDLMLVAHDITEQVLARKRVEEMSAEAAHRTEELRRAHDELKTRARELTALLNISRNLASTLRSRPLLEVILDQLRVMIDYTGAAVFTPLEGGVTIVAYRGPLSQADVVGTRSPMEHVPGLEEVLQRREPVIYDDLHGDAPQARHFMAAIGPRMLHILGQSRSWMGVPLMIQDRVIGLLRFDHLEPGHFTPHHARIALTIANQAAIAMENARLYEEAGKVATLEERQRLARELHDSVSQALYGIALGTHAAREQVDRAPDRLKDTLNYVLGLAETAVIEMRALIFELRPESLEQEGLAVALSRLADTSRNRDGIDVRLDLCPEPELSADAREVLYRIAQEALRNTGKHARARIAHLRMSCDHEQVVLEIEDDGIGFDSTEQFPGHYGLHSMRERAVQLGGRLEIRSAPDHGTMIRACVPLIVAS